MPNMTGRPGSRTMEMIGGSSAPYLDCTPCVPLFCTLFNRGGNRGAFRLPGAARGSFPLYGGTFARSYSVSRKSLFSHFGATLNFSGFWGGGVLAGFQDLKSRLLGQLTGGSTRKKLLNGQIVL